MGKEVDLLEKSFRTCTALVSSHVEEQVEGEEELQEQRREIQRRARVISGQVMHHSADPSTEAVHHQRRDRCDCSNRTSETKPKSFPEKRLMNITCRSHWLAGSHRT